MSDVRVIIQRDSEREERVVTTGTTAADLFTGERTIVAARVAGELRDLAYEVQDGEEVEPVEISSEDGLNILRHSTAHVMAQAVQELFPDAKLGIGPPVKDGFYYDFDVEKPFTPEDLKAVEKKMQEIQKRGQRFSAASSPTRAPARSSPRSRTSWNSSASRAPLPRTTARTSRWAAAS